MRICVDFTSAIGDPTGVGTYTRHLVRALLDRPEPLVPTLAVHVYRHPGWHGRIRDILGPGLLLRVEDRLRGPAAEDLFGPADVFHGTNFLLPPLRRARGVATVHDLAFVRFRNEIPVAHRYLEHIGATLRRASRIVVPSEATRRDVLEFFPVPAHRVVVVPEGGPVEFPTLTETGYELERRRLGIPERFLLFVGTLEPRKNLPVLIRAYLAARPRLPRGTGLVLAGRPGWHDDGIRAAIRNAARTAPVVATGFVPEPLRNSLLMHALAFAFPSRYEGFASDAGALPEVVGDAALLADPGDVDGLAENLVRAVTDEPLRAVLAERGRLRLAGFRWDEAAQRTLEVYESA